MKYWIGALLGSFGAYLFIAAQGHRSRIKAAREEAVRQGRPATQAVEPNSVAALGEMVAPIVMFALGWFTLKLCLAYYILGPLEYFTLFDLAGTLVLVAGYASWLLAKTHYRMPPDAVVWVADADHAIPATVADRQPRPRAPADSDGAVHLFPYPAAAARPASARLAMEKHT